MLVLSLFAITASAQEGQVQENQEEVQQAVQEGQIDETTLLLGADDGPTNPAVGQDELSVGGIGGLIRMVLVLAIVLAMIYGVIWFLRRLQQPRRPETSLITLAATQPLGGSRAVHLVQVGNQSFLVGEGDSNVQLIAEITDKETLDDIRLKAPMEHQQKSFADLLAGMFRGSKTDDREEENSGDTTNIHEETPSLDFLQKRRERLKEL